MKTGPDRKYTVEFREAAIKQVLEGGRGVSAVARSLEMSVKTLTNWVRIARSGKPSGGHAPVSDLQAELSQLRQENARLKMEREILKKATAYFAKDAL